MGFDKLIHRCVTTKIKDWEHFHHHPKFPCPFPVVFFTLIHPNSSRIWHEVWIEVHFSPKWISSCFSTICKRTLLSLIDYFGFRVKNSESISKLFILCHWRFCLSVCPCHTGHAVCLTYLCICSVWSRHPWHFRCTVNCWMNESLSKGRNDYSRAVDNRAEEVPGGDKWLQTTD